MSMPSSSSEDLSLRVFLRFVESFDESWDDRDSASDDSSVTFPDRVLAILGLDKSCAKCQIFVNRQPITMAIQAACLQHEIVVKKKTATSLQLRLEKISI